MVKTIIFNLCSATIIPLNTPSGKGASWASSKLVSICRKLYISLSTCWVNLQWWSALQAKSILWCLWPLKYSLIIRNNSVADSFLSAPMIRWCMSCLTIVENNVNVTELLEWYLKQSSSSIIILRGPPLGVPTTNNVDGYTPPSILVVSTPYGGPRKIIIEEDDCFKYHWHYFQQWSSTTCIILSS